MTVSLSLASQTHIKHPTSSRTIPIVRFQPQRNSQMHTVRRRFERAGILVLLLILTDLPHPTLRPVSAALQHTIPVRKSIQRRAHGRNKNAAWNGREDVVWRFMVGIVECFPSRSVEIVEIVDIVDVMRSAWPPQRIWSSEALPTPLFGEVVRFQLLVLSFSLCLSCRARPGLHPRGMIFAARSH
jgi:hypothetical protein